MPRIKEYGNRLASGSQDAHKVVANPASKAAAPRIQYDRFTRIGKHPSAHLWNQINESTNQSVLYRTREIFRACGYVGAGGGSGSGGAGSWVRYRFAFRTGVYAHAVRCLGVMIPQTSGLTGNAYGKITIYSDTAEAVTVTSGIFYHGVNPGGSLLYSEGLPYLKPITTTLSGLNANTDYYAKVEGVDNGNILAFAAWELASMTQNGGYLAQNISAETEIYDVYREHVATIQKNLAKRSGGLALNFAVDTASNVVTNATNTSKNVSDSSTTFDDATPCLKVDMTYRNRLSQTSGVPVAMKVYCKTTDVGGSGRVYLRDSAGNAVITITNGIPTAAGGSWISTTGFLPATQDKYYLHFDNNGSGTISIWAISIYEYEA